MPNSRLKVTSGRGSGGVGEANLKPRPSNLPLSLGSRRCRSRGVHATSTVRLPSQRSVAWRSRGENRIAPCSNPWTVPGTSWPSITLTVLPEGHDTHTPPPEKSLRGITALRDPSALWLSLWGSVKMSPNTPTEAKVRQLLAHTPARESRGPGQGMTRSAEATATSVNKGSGKPLEGHITFSSTAALGPCIRRQRQHRKYLFCRQSPIGGLAEELVGIEFTESSV